MANWQSKMSGGAKLSLADGRFFVVVRRESKPGPRSAGGPDAWCYSVEVFGSHLTRNFPDLETAKNQGEEAARKVLQRALAELT